MQISALNFKTNCLKYMEIATKQNDNIYGILKETVIFNDDIVESPLEDIEWEAQTIKSVFIDLMMLELSNTAKTGIYSLHIQYSQLYIQIR